MTNYFQMVVLYSIIRTDLVEGDEFDDMKISQVPEFT